MPIVNAYGKRINFPDDMSHEEIANVISANEKDLNPDYTSPNPEALDYAKGFAAGANKLVSGVGYLAEAAGAKETGKAIREFGDRGAAYWNSKLSTGGKKAAESQVFVDDPESITGLRLGDNAGKALLMGASQSLPSMFAAALPGVAITKGIQALASLGLAGGAGATIPLLAGTAAPVGTAANVIARVPSAIGFGAAEGAVSGAMNAADFKSSIEGMSDKELSKSPVYLALKAEHGEEKAKQLIADQAASDIFGRTALSTGAIGAVTGGGALGQAYQKATTGAADGIVKSFLKGAGQEAIQETPQSAGEKYIENLATKDYINPDVDTSSGVLSSAASGGAVGAFTGGIFGAGSAVNITTSAQQKADRINAERAKLGLDKIVKSTTVDEAINAANESVSQKPVDKEDVLRVADPTLADIERLTGLKPSESIQEAERQQSILSQAQQENNATQDDLEGQNNQKQKTQRDTEIVLPDNKTLNAQWDIVDADNVKASLKNGESQPRDRTRAASDLQIQSIAKNPDYRRLSDSPVMDIGAPVLSNDGQIVGGNGRFEAISRAYDQDTAQEYIDNLRQDAIKKGIDPAVIDQMKKPVLVRRITQPFDTRQLAIASNSGMSAQYSDLEQAKIDSERLKGLEDILTTDNGDIALTADNIRRVRDALGNYSPAEIAPFVDANGQLSQQGMKRIRNAMLAKAYGDNQVIQGLIESNDSDIRNILGALTRVVGDVIKAKANAPKESDITPSILEAVNIYNQLRQQNKSVSSYLQQQDAFAERAKPAVENVLMFLDKNARSQPKLTDFFRDAYTKLGSIDTKTADIFGEKVKPKPEDLFAKPKELLQPSATLKKDSSWIIKNKKTGEILFETFDKDKVDNLNTNKYEAIPAIKHLQGINTYIKGETVARELQDHLKKNGYEFDVKPVTEREFNALPEPKKAQKELAEKQAKIFGKKVVFVKTKGKFGINGVMVPAIKDTIFIDLNTPKPFHAVMAHELSHWMEQENPAAYKDMLGALKNIIVNEEGYRKKYGITDQTKGLIPREIAGDLMGDNFTKPEFWKKVAEYNPSKFKEIAKDIIKWLKNIVLKAKSRGMGSEEWVTDAKKAQDIIAKAVSQYTKEQDAKGEKVEFKKKSEGELKLSKDKQEKLPEAIKELEKSWDAKGISNFISEKNGVITLSKIVIPKDQRDSGLGTMAMNDLISYADKTGQRIELTPSSDFGGIKSRLISFYKKFGFIENKGRNKDYSISESMFRDPVPANIAVSKTLSDTINIDGTDRPTTNSEGKPIYPTEEGVRNFWRWFGDSKVVDDQGRPLVVYHGTNDDFNEFKNKAMRDSGWHGEGFYFYPKELWSRGYGKNIISVYLKIENPAIRETINAANNKNESLNVNEYIKTHGNDGVIAYDSDGSMADIVVFNPNQIKSAIGNNGEFSESNNNILLSKEKPFNPNEDIEETKAQYAQRIGQDKFNRFKVIKEWLAKEKGINLSEAADVYGAEERYYGKVANQQEDFREKVRNPLIEKISKAGYKLDDVEQYLLNRHAQEANAQNRKLTGKQDSTAYGISDADAQAYLDKAPKELAKLADEVQALTDKAQQLRLDNGIETDERVNAMKSAYQYYVPVRGDAESQQKQNQYKGTGKGFSMKYKPKRRLGHELRNEGVIENIFQDYKRAIIQVEDNRVGKALALMAAEIQMTELISINQPVKRKVLQTQKAYGILVKGELYDVFQNEESAKQNRQLLVAADKKLTLSDITIAPITDQRLIYSASPMLADNEVLVYMNGHEIRLQINDELLARAYKNMGTEALGNVLSTGRAINGWMSKAYTGYNPYYILVNLLRDFQTGFANLTGEQGILIAAKAVANYPKSFASLLKYAFNGKPDKWIDAYRDNGGNTGAAYLPDLERLGEEVKREYASYQGVIANLKEGDSANALRAAGRKAFNATLKYINHLNAASENAFRLATFKAMVESGNSVNESASMAKNVTVNFNRKGELGSELSALYLFFNPSIQGTAVTSHALFKGRHKFQAWGLVGSMMTIGYMMASMLGGFDDEDKYDEISDATKSRNLIMAYGDGYLKIPIPYGYGFFYNSGRMFAEAQRKGELGKMPYQLMALAIEEFSPFNVATTEDSEFSSKKVFYGFLPTMLKIPAEITNNFSSFTNRELYPEKTWYKSEPDNEKMWRGTKGTVYDISAQYLASIGVEISPEVLKYMNRTATGGSGTFVDQVVSGAMLKSQGAELEAREIPFVNKFYGENTIQDARSRYGKAKEEARMAFEKFNALKQKNDISSVRSFVDDKKELLALNSYANKLSDAIKNIRDRQDAIKLSDHYTTAEKRLKIKELEKEEKKYYDMFMSHYKTVKH